MRLLLRVRLLFRINVHLIYTLTFWVSEVSVFEYAHDALNGATTFLKYSQILTRLHTVARIHVFVVVLAHQPSYIVTYLL